jgi:probable HAF family extracellular repeat protein
MSRRIRSTLSALALASLALPALGGDWRYTFQSAQITLLPNAFRAGGASEALDINMHGQIVGWEDYVTGVRNAWLYEPSGSYKYVGGPSRSIPSVADGINNLGEVVGTTSENHFGRGFHWSPGTGFNLLGHELQPGQTYNSQYGFTARAINDFGRIVGSAEATWDSEGIPYSPCTWDIPIEWARPDAEPRVLYCPPEPNGENEARAVNIYGWTAGFETTTKNRGFRFHENAVSYVPWPAGGKKDGMGVYGMNQKASVTGFGAFPMNFQPMYWDGKTAASIGLGLLPGGSGGRGFDINDDEFVTGYSERFLITDVGSFVGHRAFIWRAEMGMLELPAPPPVGGPIYESCQANALANFKITSGNAGVVKVVGYCQRGNKKHAVRWDVEFTRYWLP